MKFNVNQQDLQKSLNYCQGVIEKRSTLPILSNVLLEVANSKLTITATDLDLIFIHQIPNVEVIEEGKTTSSSSIIYDIVRKFSNDWDFSAEGRIRQANRMKTFADFEKGNGRWVICDFVAPTEKAREAFAPDYVIWMDTIKAGRIVSSKFI